MQTLDRRAVIWMNEVAQQSAVGRSVVAALARWLSFVEIVLMLVLGATARRSSVPRMLVAVGAVYVACEGLGAIWPRQRPFAALASSVRSLVEHDAQRSFPSRHVASGLAMALIGGAARPRMGVTMAVVACALGISRVAVGLHYPSDVLGGAALGLVLGRYIRRP